MMMLIDGEPQVRGRLQRDADSSAQTVHTATEATGSKLGGSFIAELSDALVSQTDDTTSDDPASQDWMATALSTAARMMVARLMAPEESPSTEIQQVGEMNADAFGHASERSPTAASRSARKQGVAAFSLAPGQTYTENADGTVTLTNTTKYGTSSVTGSRRALGLATDISPAYQRIVNGRNGHFFDSTPSNAFLGQASLGWGSGQQTGTPATQGTGPWSDAGYRNGSDIESDNAAAGPAADGQPPAPAPALSPTYPPVIRPPGTAEPIAGPDSPTPAGQTDLTFNTIHLNRDQESRLRSGETIADYGNVFGGSDGPLADSSNALKIGQNGISMRQVGRTVYISDDLSMLSGAELVKRAENLLSQPGVNDAKPAPSAVLSVLHDLAGAYHDSGMTDATGDALVFPDYSNSPTDSNVRGITLPVGATITAHGGSLEVRTALAAVSITIEGAGAGAGPVAGLAVESLLGAIGRLMALPFTVGLALLLATPHKEFEYTDVSLGLRFKTRPSDTVGRLERMQPDGTWKTIEAEIRVEEIPFSSMLTPEERARLSTPIFTPPPPGPVPTTPPPSLPDKSSGVETQLGKPGDVLTPATPLVTPAEPMLTLDDLIIESRGFGTAGSPEHKLATWHYYQARGGEWDYGRWSKNYDENQTRAVAANAAADAYHLTLGWGTREVTIRDIGIDGTPMTRRLDIADEGLRKGIEYKTGYQSATVDNLWELQRDQELVNLGWNVEWVFRDSASQPLLDALDKAGIEYKVGQ